MGPEKIRRRGFLGFLAAATATAGVTVPAAAAAVEAPSVKKPESMADRVRAMRHRPPVEADAGRPGRVLPTDYQLAEARRHVFQAIANMQVRSLEMTIAVAGPATIRAVYEGECRGRALESFENPLLMRVAEVTEESWGYLMAECRDRGRRKIVVEWMVP